MAYICDDPICDPVCDFCWFCEHDENGVPVFCKKGKEDNFGEGLGYCDEFRCALHESNPFSKDASKTK